MGSDGPSVRDLLGQFLALERDVLVLSVAMFAFSLGFQMTGRYLPRYMELLGAGLKPVVAALFAVSGLRFAGLPAHKALIVGPAEADAGGRVTGAYYLVRNTLTVASAVGLVGVASFLAFGEEFEAYA